jgi:two-component system, cell cycle response regulator DivK
VIVKTMVRRSVLLVADSADEREMYAEHFRRQGFCTLQASTVPDALRLASELRPAVVVTDVRLAGPETGVDLAARLKSDEQTREMPVVILTGCVFPRDRETAMQAGCDLFVPKPCLPDELSTAVTSIIGRSSAAVD